MEAAVAVNLDLHLSSQIFSFAEYLAGKSNHTWQLDRPGLKSCLLLSPPPKYQNSNLFFFFLNSKLLN